MMPATAMETTPDLAAPIPMITPAQVRLVIEPVDMRLGIDGLSLYIQNTLACAPCDGSVFVFRNRTSTRLKLLVWDGCGVWLAQRRLHRGHFVWPNHATPSVVLTAQQWQWLITGVDWQRLCAKAPAEWQF